MDVRSNVYGTLESKRSYRKREDSRARSEAAGHSAWGAGHQSSVDSEYHLPQTGETEFVVHGNTLDLQTATCTDI